MDGPEEHSWKYEGSMGVIGDFNVVLYPEERMGGEGTQHVEMNDFVECLEDSKL